MASSHARAPSATANMNVKPIIISISVSLFGCDRKFLSTREMTKAPNRNYGIAAAYLLLNHEQPHDGAHAAGATDRRGPIRPPHDRLAPSPPCPPAVSALSVHKDSMRSNLASFLGGSIIVKLPGRACVCTGLRGIWRVAKSLFTGYLPGHSPGRGIGDLGDSRNRSVSASCNDLPKSLRKFKRVGI